MLKFDSPLKINHSFFYSQFHKLEIDAFKADKQKPTRLSRVSMDAIEAELVKDKIKESSDQVPRTKEQV